MLQQIFRFFCYSTVFLCLLLSFSIITAQKVCIVIPAYNEQDRIIPTLKAYTAYFESKPEKTTFLVVANNCSDKTVELCQELQRKQKNVEILEFKPGGKGFAVRQGFLWALSKNFDLIGFVDADMATLPQYFYDLVLACKDCDGAIASRYAQGAIVKPQRPWFKKMCGKTYNWVLRQQFDFPYKDTQCGAKIFTKDTIEKVAHNMQEPGWAFDFELLYLCELEGKNIKEVPTTWSDQPGSRLEISSKVIKEFTTAPKRIKQRHAEKRKQIKKEKLLKKKKKNKKKTQAISSK